MSTRINPDTGAELTFDDLHRWMFDNYRQHMDGNAINVDRLEAAAAAHFGGTPNSYLHDVVVTFCLDLAYYAARKKIGKRNNHPIMSTPHSISKLATPEHSPEYAIYDGPKAIARVMGEDAKERAYLYANAHELFRLCEQSLMALHEDDFPNLREELRQAISNSRP